MKTRRELIKDLLLLAGTVAAGPSLASAPRYHAARYWSKMGNSILCELCPNGCVLPEGKTGDCRNRKNSEGKLVTLGYSRPCAVNVDPVEKKPLYHFLPGARTFSLAIAGCNLRCKNCQNYALSQKSPLETENYNLPPEKVIQEARRLDCKIIAYTYSEPTVWIEYVLDTAALARKAGLKNVLVTSGYINQGPFSELAELIDAAHIDLKSFDNRIYQDLNAGKLQPVLDTLKLARKKGVWVEIINLVVPQWTDKPEMIRSMCRWIAKELGTEVPLHFSRFFPLYKLAHLYPTPSEVLLSARKIALEEKLKFVYIGNVMEMDSNTYCLSCGELLISRSGYVIKNRNLKSGSCGKCGTAIPGVWA